MDYVEHDSTPRAIRFPAGSKIRNGLQGCSVNKWDRIGVRSTRSLWPARMKAQRKAEEKRKAMRQVYIEQRRLAALMAKVAAIEAE